METTRAHLIDLIKKTALRTGDFTLASGKKSSYYLDCRNVTLSGTGAHCVGTMICHMLRSYDHIDAIGGLTMGADPIVGATLAMSCPIIKHELKGFLVRKEPKGHGTNQLVEGPVVKGSRVIIVEDVTTTGHSAMRAVEAIRQFGAEVVAVITLVDRLEGAKEFFYERDVRFDPILTITDLGINP